MTEYTTTHVAGGYEVEVRERPDAPPLKQRFATEAEARTWISQQIRMAEMGTRFENRAPRNWRD